MTARQIAKDGQARIDKILTDMIQEYGLDKMQMQTVKNAMADEIGTALEDLRVWGRIRTNAERWK